MSNRKRSTPSRARTAALKLLDPQVALDELVEAQSVESIASEMVQLILDKGANILYTHYIQSLAEDRTAQETVGSIIDVIEFQLSGHDQGELLSAEENQRLRERSVIGMDIMNEPDEEEEPETMMPPMWTAEEEPRPCEIDRWASGMIPIKVKKKPVMPALGPSKRESDTMSRNSLRSTSSRRTYRSRRTAARRSFMGGKAVFETRKKQDDLRYVIEVVQTEHEISLERLRQHELKKMEKKRRAQEAKLKLKQAAEEEQRRYEKLKAELSGKAYTFDESGNVVMVVPPNPKTMPAFSRAPRVRVMDKTNEEDEQTRRPRRDERRNNKSKKKKPKKKARSQDDFVDLGSMQPPLSETLVLAPGVGLKHGRTTKAARDEATQDPSKMTWAQYNKMIVGSRAATAEDPRGTHRVLTPSQGGVLEAKGARVKENEEDAAQIRRRARKEEEERAAREAEAQNEAETWNLEKDADQNKTDEEPEAVEGEDAEDDFNATILNDPAWGQNPDVPLDEAEVKPLPANPPKNRSPHKRLPRERPYVSEPLSPLKAALTRLDPTLPALVGGQVSPLRAYYSSNPLSRSGQLAELLPVDGELDPGLTQQKTERPRGFFPEPVSRNTVEATDKAKFYFRQ